MKYKIIDASRDEQNKYPYMVETQMGIPVEVFKTKEEAEQYVATLSSSTQS